MMKLGSCSSTMNPISRLDELASGAQEVKVDVPISKMQP